MKKHMAVALIASLLASVAAIAAPDEAALMAKEKAAWQAFKDKKADDFKKIVGANMKAVYADGIADLQKEIADMQKWDMKSFTIGDYKVTAADADTAISTYTVKVEGSIGGSDASGTYNAGSVWQQKGGDWQAIFHTNVLQQGAAK
jgi:hypothetical protein